MAHLFEISICYRFPNTGCPSLLACRFREGGDRRSSMSCSPGRPPGLTSSTSTTLIRSGAQSIANTRFTLPGGQQPFPRPASMFFASAAPEAIISDASFRRGALSVTNGYLGCRLGAGGPGKNFGKEAKILGPPPTQAYFACVGLLTLWKTRFPLKPTSPGAPSSSSGLGERVSTTFFRPLQLRSHRR